MHRDQAAIIHKTLYEAKELKSEMSVEELKQWGINKINKTKIFQVEYFDIVEDKELTDVKSWSENNTKVACIAVYAGQVRLIDNMTL